MGRTISLAAGAPMSEAPVQYGGLRVSHEAPPQLRSMSGSLSACDAPLSISEDEEMKLMENYPPGKGLGKGGSGLSRPLGAPSLAAPAPPLAAPAPPTSFICTIGSDPVAGPQKRFARFNTNTKKSLAKNSSPALAQIQNLQSRRQVIKNEEVSDDVTSDTDEWDSSSSSSCGANIVDRICFAGKVNV